MSWLKWPRVTKPWDSSIKILTKIRSGKDMEVEVKLAIIENNNKPWF